ncbi:MULTISPECIES: hypothetical protein [unclassified Vibrio]|uniref:hypothetical protein n=1 Tax=unclassified Vibrio TaxID=2614977 RepID=UPI00136180FD|nr:MULTISPECIES: hypothetical protein [unclassified Vibrio]NAW58483.1 hypothetical protein [Vibrio sp. V36_P2S2PM302]NAX24955.1 hypothetical protein [Vibrio sp. V38_P2S17PM301]NAX32555.1 hypothetical protein [Vibrio sp. V37_P2S8PM304]
MNYRSKVFIALSLLLSGCASSHANIEDLEKQWQERIDYCVELARQNEVPFPDSDWFQSLSVEDRKNVAGYLANYNDRQCSKVETEALLKAIREQNAQEVFDRNAVDLIPLEVQAAERMKNIDMVELMELQKRFSEPFSLRYVMEEQGWFSPQ